MSQHINLGDIVNIVFDNKDVDILNLNGNTIWKRESENPVAKLISRTIKKIDGELTQEITAIGRNVFQGCTLLESVKIPSSVKTIGINAFSECTALTEIVIPDGVTVLEGGVFAQCSSLTHITIPSGVTKLDINLFIGCSSLTEMTVLPTTPPSLASGAVSGATTTIYVPSESLDAYKSSATWGALMTRETNPVTFVGI